MITVRASLSGQATILGSGFGLAVSGLISGFFRGHTGAQLFIPSLIVLAVMVLVALAFRVNSRITAEGDRITVRTLIGTSHGFAIDDVAELVDARHVETGFSPTARLAFLDAEGFALLRLRPRFWDSDALRALTSSFGEKRTVLPEVITARDLLERYPFAVGFRTRRPFLGFGLVLVAVFAVVLGYVWFLDVLEA
ncbi:hypothetical protein EYE40_14630 [Glaciihabitans arcticus]|uniref:PH domain-containing protein n=1 Tax=Glaciihabitans arcticus TaxID=2668039 RepID=A0A4Q9GLY8_9MICO|nr:hypothetical protein [Glaciihabitans arcticus]TBN55439.1 hypothetical protein EYE40_14630 [Glaciihabitans arcticus]